MPPPPLVNGLWTNFVDEKQNQSAGFWTTQDQTLVPLSPWTELLLTTQLMSGMALFGFSFSHRAGIEAETTDGPYNTYQDQAVMVVQSANATAELVIPGPVEGIFYDDHQLVDLSNPLVQAWWVQVQALLGDTIGSPWTQLRRGYRRKVGV